MHSNRIGVTCLPVLPSKMSPFDPKKVLNNKPYNTSGMRKKQSYVNIPTELAEEIDKEFVGNYGFTSRAEFVEAAIRRAIEIYRSIGVHK